jgi:protein-L-isoaspartate(D-aspartate) O-methyltransferase
MIDLAAVRRNMVDTQLRTYDVSSKRVLDAVDEVGREHFLPASLLALAYADQSLTVRTEDGSERALLLPMILARMIQAAEIQPGAQVLSVAGGTGYGAAVMAAMGAKVTLLESSESMASAARRALAPAGAETVAVVAGPLADGHPAGAPYDVILVEGALEVEPNGLLAQLSDGGRLVAIMGLGRAGRVTLFQRSGESMGRRSVFDAAGVALAGFRAPADFRF